MTHRGRTRLALFALVLAGFALLMALWFARGSVSAVLDQPQAADDVLVHTVEGVDPASTRALGVTPRGDLLHVGRPAGSDSTDTVCVIVTPGPGPTGTVAACGGGTTVSVEAGDMTVVLHRWGRVVGLWPGDGWSRFVDVDYATP